MWQKSALVCVHRKYSQRKLLYPKWCQRGSAGLFPYLVRLCWHLEREGFSFLKFQVVRFLGILAREVFVLPANFFQRRCRWRHPGTKDVARSPCCDMSALFINLLHFRLSSVRIIDAKRLWFFKCLLQLGRLCSSAQRPKQQPHSHCAAHPCCRLLFRTSNSSACL